MKTELSKKIKLIEEGLYGYMEIPDIPQRLVYEAMSYSVRAGGKRLRPMLVLECGKMCGGEDTGALMPFACAVEMIHTYSLIHDDLPAMDNDDYRRGRLTCHKVFGEAEAILAGDALLNLAFETALAAENVETDKKLEALKILAGAAGAGGMIGGQTVDLMSEGKKISFEELKYIHKLKTGALIGAACEMGAVLAGAEPKEREIIKSYAEYLGIAFQITDDILDVTADEAELGKPVGSDEKNQKSTYVTVFGLDKAREYAKSYTDKAVEELKYFGERADFLIRLTEYLCGRSF